MYKCPLCEVEIERLLYRENATIYGTYYIDTQEYQQDETENEGGIELYCPECDRRINSIDNLINTEEERTTQRTEQSNPRPLNLDPWSLSSEEPEQELPVPPAIDQNWDGQYSGYHNSHNMPKLSEILVCPKCNQKIEAKIDETVECSNCNKEFNRATAKQIIPIDNN